MMARGILFLAMAFCTSVPNVTHGASADYFSSLDATIPAGSNGRYLVAERFYRIMARLSIFAIYCDPTPQHSWNQAVAQHRRSMVQLTAEADQVFGGGTVAYNKFEALRNDESLRFASSPDQGVACRRGLASFQRWLKMNETELNNLFSSRRLGTL